jgi:hypothetical protein
LWREIRHNCVDRCNHIPTIFAQYINHPLDFCTDFV